MYVWEGNIFGQLSIIHSPTESSGLQTDSELRRIGTFLDILIQNSTKGYSENNK